MSSRSCTRQPSDSKGDASAHPSLLGVKLIKRLSACTFASTHHHTITPSHHATVTSAGNSTGRWERQQALKESVSHAITLGFKDIQIRLLQTDFKGMMSAVPDSLKADLQRKPDEAASKIQNRIENLAGKRIPGKGKK